MATKMKKSKLRDFDPESLLDPAPSSSDSENSDFESEEDSKAGREHYEDVGKSKLRKKESVPLGPKYTGSRIGRDLLEDEDSDDPFARSYDIGDSEDESEEDDAFMNGNEGAPGEESEEVDDEPDSEVDMEYGDMDPDVEEENIDDASDDSEGEDTAQTSELRRMMNDAEDDEEEDQDDNEEDDPADKVRKLMQDTSLVASTISQAAKADVEKGKAIKIQRKTFDGLLNTRVRLQKALISTNSMASETHTKATAPNDAIQAAESAALTLLSNLNDLRSSLDEARTGQKRKRSVPFTSSTSPSEIWSEITVAESKSRPHRNAILEKWSTKTRGATISNSKGRLNATAQQTLTDVLNAQLQDSSRLIARTQVPRSCAPVQSAANVPSSEAIYDDADFYGLLLKELLENRSNELNTNGAASEFVVQAPWQIAREAKTKKVVDTKASKGRKLRYTVHEKLQNFMAPEDRGNWGDRQREELFGGLFGRRVALGEEEDVQSDEDDGIDAEEEGLTLFQS